MSIKNLHTGGYARVNGDTIKTTSSMIFQGPPKLGGSNIGLKHVKQPEPQPRPTIIPRYASEEELKKLPISPNSPKQKKIPNIETEYYKRTHATHQVPTTTSTPTSSIISKASTYNEPKKHSTSKHMPPEKKIHDPVPHRKYIGDTNSTCSNEKSRRQSPSQSPGFFKTKGKVMMGRMEMAPKKVSRENFKLLRKLGEGKFGKVFLALELATGFVLAMKIIEKKKIIQDNILEQFTRELKIQAFLQHPNIITLYGFFHDEIYFYSLMEVGCDGPLYSLIEQNKNLTEMATSFIAKSLLEAVQCMHNSKILHRDIKPENIVLIMGNVKMCDFGWAVNKVKKQELRSTFCGTPLYLSPEILKGYKYDEKVDLWAIGVLAYELCIGSSPFQINEQQDLYKILTQDVRFPKSKHVSPEFQQFVSCILHKNPKDRLPSEQLLRLRFIKKYEDFETCEELCS